MDLYDRFGRHMLNRILYRMYSLGIEDSGHQIRRLAYMYSESRGF